MESAFAILAEPNRRAILGLLAVWNTNFLDNLWVEVLDAPYENGVIGKHIIFNMEERQRVKIVDYIGSKQVEQTKIDEKLKEANTTIRLDSFIDEGTIRKVQGIVQEMLAEKGYMYAKVTHSIKEMPGGPKLVHLTFNIDEGPKVRIESIDFATSVPVLMRTDGLEDIAAEDDMLFTDIAR